MYIYIYIYIYICNLQSYVTICKHHVNMESRVDIYDIYLHVKKMRLKSPDVFLTLVLKEFEITNLGRFFMSIFYVTCFLWHYPSHGISILRAIYHVFSFKVRNLYNIWNESWSTYSPYAQNLRAQIHSNEDQVSTKNL